MAHNRNRYAIVPIVRCELVKRRMVASGTGRGISFSRRRLNGAGQNGEANMLSCACIRFSSVQAGQVCRRRIFARCPARGSVTCTKLSWPPACACPLTLSISGGARRRPLHAVVSRHFQFTALPSPPSTQRCRFSSSQIGRCSFAPLSACPVLRRFPRQKTARFATIPRSDP